MVHGMRVQVEVFGGFPGDFLGSRFLNAKSHIYLMEGPHMAPSHADDEILHVESLVFEGQG